MLQLGHPPQKVMISTTQATHLQPMTNTVVTAAKTTSKLLKIQKLFVTTVHLQ
jgi:hypothetical protein